MEARPPVISTSHLSKWYGQVSGLNDVTVAVPPGITGLLGPNGAGKSTFMKLITGQLRPSKGEVRVLGEPIWDNRPIYARVGFCPEQDAFYERMTGLEWVAALVRLNGLGEAAAVAAATRALDAVDLLDAKDRKIGGYSKGMRQRVKLAQAIVHEPELLILDEPLSGMDPLMRRKTIRLIKDWARAGKSILVSSHILHEIESMTANILLINNGRILAEGNVHQIRDLIDEHPHTVFVRAGDPRGLARAFLAEPGVISLKFQDDAVIVETGEPDAFYKRLTEMAATGEAGPIDEVTSPDDNLQAVFKYLVKVMTSYLRAAARVFKLSIGEMLWSRRTIFMALVLAGPVVLAIVARLVQSSGVAPLRVNGTEVGGAAIFGMMMWVLFLRFIVPVLGVFYGTSLIADEVEDKTITYLFTRPVPRGAVLLGKYAAYLVCTTLVVLPSVMIVYFLIVPLSQMAGSFAALVKDLGILALGLAAYGALFALVGAVLKRPLVIGLVFAFGWEQVALLMPGYLKTFTLAYYLQVLVPHAMPPDGVVSLLQSVFRDTPGAAASLFWLCLVLVVSLGLAMRAVERREYVLEQ